MKTLADAWRWYQATRLNLSQMQRIGRRHWNDPSLAAASIWQDEEFKALEATQIIADTRISLEPIDDLAVVVLFSVFESQVRDFLAERMKPEAEALVDPILKEAASDARQGVEEGSFYRRVLQPLKEQGRVSADLVTQIDQVRDYRNWVAHGRRGRSDQTNNVTPQIAFSRLTEFLDVLGIASESETPEDSEFAEGP